MNSTLNQTIDIIRQMSITDERQAVLEPLVSYLKEHIAESPHISLNFICTHNSRRSHLAQIWMQTFIGYFGISNINCYSGGTEATAVYHQIIDTLKQQGFNLMMLSQTDNPVYAVKYDDNALPIIAFSKAYTHRFNPQNDYVAIMTCSSADDGCPVVLGAKKRMAITYDDPKMYDNTPQMIEQYRAKSLEIASEMYYICSQINQKP